MAYPTGGIPIGGYIAPFDTNDVYAVIDPIYGIGGAREVLDLIARNAITTLRRREGMLVYVQSEDNYYYLKNGITNADWVLFGISNNAIDIIYNNAISGLSATNAQAAIDELASNPGIWQTITTTIGSNTTKIVDSIPLGTFISGLYYITVSNTINSIYYKFTLDGIKQGFSTQYKIVDKLGSIINFDASLNGNAGNIELNLINNENYIFTIVINKLIVG